MTTSKVCIVLISSLVLLSCVPRCVVAVRADPEAMMHSSKLFDYWMKIHNSYDITNEKPMDEAIIEFQPFVDKDPIGDNVQIMKDQQVWVKSKDGNPTPRGAVQVGTSRFGVPLYAGRAYYNRELLPAQILRDSSAFVSRGGEEIALFHYEVLCHTNVAWQATQGGHIPTNAIVMGSTIDGEKLYMGRTLYDRRIIPGKIHPSLRRIYMPFNGIEVYSTEYEFMVDQSGDNSWITKDQLVWVKGNSSIPTPSSAVQVGVNIAGIPLYAGRTFYESNLLPAQIIKDSLAYVSLGGKEDALDHYEVLCGANVAWQATQEGHIPKNAIVMGFHVDGEKLYMGRTLHEGRLIPGKIHSSLGRLYMPYNGKEIYSTEYEIMIGPKDDNVRIVKDQQVPSSSSNPSLIGAVQMGSTEDSTSLYMGRSSYERDLLLTKKNKDSFEYVNWGGELDLSKVNNHLSSAEQTVNEINIPPNAIVIGSTGQGAKLYMGGALHERILTPKKVHLRHRKLNIPYRGARVRWVPDSPYGGQSSRLHIMRYIAH